MYVENTHNGETVPLLVNTNKLNLSADKLTELKNKAKNRRHASVPFI